MTKKTGHGGFREGSGRKPLTPEEQEAKRLRRNQAARNRRAKAAGKAAGTPAAEIPATVPAAPKGQPAGAWGDARALEALMDLMGKRSKKRSRSPAFNPFQIAQHPPQATPSAKSKLRMAMDQGFEWAGSQWAGGAGIFAAVGAEGLQFLGYPYLSELTQRTEYRIISETIADDATRKWIDFDVTGTIEDKEKKREDEETEEADESGQPVDPGEEKQAREDRVKSSGKMEKVKQLKDELARLELRDCMYRICRDDGFFGRSHLFMDFGDDFEKPETMQEMKTPIGDGRDALSRGKVGPKKPLVAVRPIEPVWCYPTTYNAINPLRDDWYNPQVWYVMGREIHKSRLPTFVGHPVPDLLKPAYSFGGLSLSQIAQPYVNIWLQTRDSVGELIHSFSVMVLMTDVQTNLAPGATGGPGTLMARVAAFNDFRDNMNTFVVNKNSEDFKNVSAPLGGLHELQAQSQEHIMSAVRIPDIKFTGINPSGLNACLTGDTLIETDQGNVPIRDVHAGQKVMTRNGLAPIAKAWCTRYATELIEIETAGATIRCTPNHRIWLPSINAFVPAENVRPGDLLLYRGATENRNTAKQLPIEANFGGTEGTAITPPQNITPASTCFTERFGGLTTGLFRKAATFITSTEIAGTINSIISKCLRPQLMRGFMASPRDFLFPSQPNMSAAVATAASGSSCRNLRELNFAAAGASSPIDERTESRQRSRVRSALASCAAYLSRQNERTQNTALGDAQLRAKTAPHICPTITKKTVENGSNTPNVGIQSVVSSVRRVPARELVYDIQVARGHLPEFFANGVCVHNSTDGTMRAYYDTIAAYQNRFMRPNLTRIVNFVQLSLWGEIDPEITFEFESLWEMSEKEKADLQKSEAERNQTYVDLGVLAPEEIRGVLIDDPELPFGDLDPDDVPELKEEEQGGLVPEGAGRGLEAVIGEPGAGGPGGPGQPAGGGGGAPPPPKGGGGGGDPAFQDGGGAAAGGANVLPFRARGTADELDPLFASLANDAAIEWNEPDHPRDEKGEFTAGAAAGKASHAAQTGGPAPKTKGYGWHAGPAQHYVMPQFGLWGPPSMGGEHHWKPAPPPPPLDPSALKRVGKQMGSNPGGVFEDEKGRRFYVKEGRSKDHVRNEMTAADLYDLAGAPTLNYREVAGGAHIASEMEKLDKDRASQLSDAERKKAKRDFAAHAWTANYDAVGTGGDNLVAAHGEPFSVDLGGALEYRAQGKPKGAMFGNQVTELDTMRDPGIAPDASKVFGDITPSEFRESAARVTRIRDDDIREVIKARGGSDALADKMIARKNDIARRAKTFGAEGKPEKKTSTVIFPAGDALPVKTLNGIAFKPWKPPADGDWNEVEGQTDIEDEEPLPATAQGKQLASGVVMREKDGRIWLVRPKGGFGGYDHTFPKGRVEPSLSMQANAIKEAWEETGLKAKITGHAGDRVGDTTLTRYYFAEREGGDPSQAGEESEGVVLAPADKLDLWLNRERDRKLAKEIATDELMSGFPHSAFQPVGDEESGAPRTLYVNRPLLNAGNLAAWARERGVEKLLPADEMHVTVAFSKTPLAWADAGNGATKVIAKGGARSIERLGNEGAVVLRFECPALERRWRQIVDAGASWDHPGYKPHVTFTMGETDLDVDLIEPFEGPLEFGPEEWDEIGNRPADWAAKAKASLIASDAWEEGKHKRGQPENKGQFGPGGGGKTEARTAGGRTALVRQRPAARPAAQGSKAVAPRAAAGAPAAMPSPAEHFAKAAEQALAKATPEERREHAEHVDKTRKFFSSDGGRKASADAVKDFVAKHAVGVAQHHIQTAMLMPVVHHAVEAAVEAVGLAGVPGLTLGATAVAAYAAHHLMHEFGFSLSGAKELLVGAVRGAIDVLGGVKDVAARIADLEKSGLVGDEDNSVLDALILLLLALEDVGEPEPAQDEAKFEEAKHPRDATGEFTSKGGEGGGGEGETKKPPGEGTNQVSTTEIVEKANENANKQHGGKGLDGLSPLQVAQHKYKAAMQLGSNYASATWATTSEEDDALKQVYGSTENAWKTLAETELNKETNPFPKSYKQHDLWNKAHGITSAETSQESFKAEIAKIDNAEGEYADLDTNLKSAEAKVKAAVAYQMAPDGLTDVLSASEDVAITDKYGSVSAAYADIGISGEIEKETGGPEGIVANAENAVFEALAKGEKPDLPDVWQEALADKYGSLDDALKALGGEPTAPASAQTDKKTKFGGLWKTTGLGEKADVQLNAKNALLKQAFAGQSYRSMLAYMIKSSAEADLDADEVAKLKAKLVEALYMAEAKAVALGKGDDVKKIGAVLGKIAGKEPAALDAGFKAFEAAKAGKPAPAYQPKAKPAAATAPPPLAPLKKMSDLEKHVPAFAAEIKKLSETYKVSSKSSSKMKTKAAVQNGATLDALMVALKPAEQKKLAKMYGSVEAAYEKYNNWYGPASPNGKAKAAAAQEQMPIAADPGKPTPKEIEKAKKTVALQLQYVPNAPAGSAEAQKLVDAFNAKWAGKEVGDADAMKKIADFKAMAEKMKPLMSAQQKAAAEANAKAAELAKKSQAEQAAAAAKETAKHAAQLDEFKKELGVGDAEAAGFEGLVNMLASEGKISKASLIDEFKKSDTQAGHGISKFEGALISRYKGSSSIVNEELRKGTGSSSHEAAASWKSPKVMFAKVLNKALSKLPAYNGVTIRNTPLTADVQMRYQPGQIVWEHGFTGTSKKKPNGVFSGNTRFYITSTAKRAADISQMHGFHGEEEVLFQANTPFAIDKVEGEIGASGEHSYRVWMTELEPW